MTSAMKKVRMKASIILAIVLVTFGLLALITNPDGLLAAQKMLTTLVELWQDFITEDIVGIV